VHNGDETALDCGGGACAGCSDGKACALDRDCQSQLCKAEVCTAAPFAPHLEVSTETDFVAATSFLYTGSGAVQRGVDAGTLESRRLSVLRGRVLGRSGTAIAGVTVSILGHPEFGSTLTRDDGLFDLALNGGGTVTVDYQKSGYLPVQRKSTAPWRSYAWLPDVVMVELDTRVTTIDLASLSAIAVAAGNPVTDQDGTRQATVLFTPGTTAVMDVGGSTQPLTTLNVRATEYTVGDAGMQAMPGDLSPTIAYTYAVELSADEALAAGASAVRFSKPVVTYVENFIGFPVGGKVPVGYYDRSLGQWVPSANGRVIKVLSITDGAADLDLDGSGAAASSSALTALGIDLAEQEKLATLYPPGTSLWRVSFDHLTPWDCNWPYVPPADAVDPPVPPKEPDPPEDKEKCEKAGSIIGCEDQTLGEALAIPGTPYTLRYGSGVVRGRKDSFTTEIPLTGPNVPASLRSVELSVLVAGQVTRRTFANTPNQRYSFVWDGKDGYGRDVYGRQQVTIKLGYTYKPVFTEPANFASAFGAFGGSSLSRSREKGTITLTSSWVTRLGQVGNANRMGAWSLDVHHAYAPDEGAIYFGNGTKRSAATIPGIIETVAGSPSGSSGNADDGAKAIGASLGPSLAVPAPYGSVYFVERDSCRIRRVTPQGLLETVAGNGTCGYSGDGANARDAKLGSFLGGIALGTDGSLYIADPSNRRIRRVTAQGLISTFAGNGVFADTGDGGPAMSASIKSPNGLAVGPDGSVYFTDISAHRVRRIALDGVISTVAGTGVSEGTGGPDCTRNGFPATQVKLSSPYGVAFGPDGSFYIADFTCHVVRRVYPTGIMRTVAGSGRGFYDGDGTAAISAGLVNPGSVAVDETGAFYVAHFGYVRRVGTDGIIMNILGPKVSGYSPDGTSSAAAKGSSHGVTLGPDGFPYYIDSSSLIRRVRPVSPRISLGETVFPSSDGRQLYVFDSSGSHTKTLDPRDGSALLSFAYDASRRLVSIADRYGELSTVERDGSGNVSAIAAPGGARTVLAVDANGHLASHTLPGGALTTLTHTTDGLLTSLVEPGGQRHTFSYDALGRLLKDEGPSGNSSTLARFTIDGGFASTVTSALGRVTTYEVASAATGGMRRRIVQPSGAVTQVSVTNAGVTKLSLPDGTITETTVGPDPRWGLLVPERRLQKVTSPGGLVSTTTSSSTVTLANPQDVFSVSSASSTTTVNGRAASTTYNAAAKTLTSTSPVGRSAVQAFDAHGRLVRFDSPGTAISTAFSYSPKGQLSEQRQGSRSMSYGYNSAGRLISATNGVGAATAFAYDSAGRVRQFTLPSGRTYELAYDANGNRSQVAMPSGSVHALGYDSWNLPAAYTAPGNATMSTARDLDGERASVTLPSGRVVATSPDASGRPAATVTFPGASVGITYVGLTQMPQSIVRTPTLGSPVGLAYTYDGALLRSLTFSGAAQGQFSYSYDNNFFLTLDAAPAVTLAHDADGLLTKDGPFTLTRGGPSGAASQITDGTMTHTAVFNESGLNSERALSVATASRYQQSLSFDDASRVVATVETAAGSSPKTTAYGYDVDGQLTSMSIDAGTGPTTYAYTYDVNGNRTSVVADGVTETATYDAQDRLTSRGGLTYSFDVDGFLAARGSDTFVYSAVGELLSATVGGTTVTYAYDGLRRRVARTEAGSTTEYLYGSPGSPFLLTHSREGNELTAYFYDPAGRLFALERAGVRYSVATDHVGTPRLVIDAAGVTVKSLEHEAFGRRLSDSAPTFRLAVGFAGGLADDVTGLVRFGFRDYEPESGRWVSRDPILFEGGQFNLYAYVANDPVNQRDPSGLAATGVCLAKQYLDKYGDEAWSRSRGDRNVNERAGNFTEELRNAEHYLYANQESQDSLGGLAEMYVLTAGYSGVKAISNGAGAVSQFLGGKNFSPFRGSPATWDEFAAGIEGANDGYFGGGGSACDCR
jgi:RHS repeat-associated protein